MVPSMKSACYFALAVTAILGAFDTSLVATVQPSVPEINGSSISAGLGLLAAGILILRARRRR